MAGVHQLPHHRPVRRAHLRSGLDGPLDFANDMASAAENDVIHPAARRLEQVFGGVTQGRHAQNLGGLLALGAALSVAAARQFMLDVRVDDEEGNGGIAHGHQLRPAGTAIQQQQVIFLAHD